MLHVAVAIIIDGAGRVLVNRRLPGTHMAGRWEFPGGKLETGEDARDGLRRELREELAIVPDVMRPLIRVRHRYPDREVLLDCWRIEAWDGGIHPREGHELDWADPEDLHDRDLLDADRPIVSALTLPSRYAITAPGEPSAILDGVTRLLDAGHTLLQLRAPELDDGRFRILAAGARAMSGQRGARLLLNSDPVLAMESGADGVHLSSKRLMASRGRPAPAGMLVAASCHDADEIAHAAAVGCDFAVLGPVFPTPSHPDAEPLGWTSFGELADCAGLPVYALGGVGEDDLETAWAHHAQGVAGIRAWW